MPESPCWPRDTLKDYLNGSADDQRLEAIESHLAVCPSCEQTVLELESNPDTLFMALREQFDELKPRSSQANSDLESEPSVIQRVLESVKQLPGSAGASAGRLEKSGQIGVRQIGAYELLQTLGRGGMGLVMLARHATLKKQVAIKILPSLIGDRPELVQRFQREIITAGQLNHPSIVHATDAGAEQGTHYLVMEYIDGLDLSRIARLGSPLSIADACEMTRQAALGLSYAHAQGVVHRDVKPSNLMLDTAGRVKILDFGLAQLNLWEEAAVELTTVGQLMGTLDYMAPEQAERVGPVDYRADLYALGATLFRLLTGRAPLAASPNMTLLEKVRMLGSQSAPLVSTLRDDCPLALVQLIEQLLSRDAAMRPASAAHVAEALQPFCIDHDLVTLLTRCRQRATEDVASIETHRMQSLRVLEPLAEPSRKPPRRRNWLMLAWLSPLAILAGIMIVLDMQKGQLVIESEVAGVKVNLLQDGKIYERLEVQTGAQATRLFADKYAIEIDGASDSVALDHSTIEIRRGVTVVAKITQKSEVTPSQPAGAAGAAATLKPRSESAALDREPSELKSHVLQGSDPELAFRVLSQRFASEPHIRMELDKATNKIIVQARPSIHQEIDQLLRMLGGQGNDFEVIDLKMDTQLAIATIEKFFGLTKSGTPDPSKPIIDGDLTNRRLYVKGSRKQLDQIKALISKIEANSPTNNNAPAAAPLGSPGTGTGHSVELLQNYASAADSLGTPGTGTEATPTPTYAGRALKDWLEVLERDLDTKTRLDTLPAIERLAGTADTETRERINRALVATIINQAREVPWIEQGLRPRPNSNGSLNLVLDTLVSINGRDAAFQLLKERCLLMDGRVSLSTIAILYALYKHELTQPASNWLLGEGRFQELEAPLVWAALAFLETNLGYQDAGFYQTLPKLILDQPQLGVPALLLLEPTPTALSRPEAAQLEDTIAQIALTEFLNEQSSPQIVAMSAHWLARTTSALEPHRLDLVAKISDRLKQLAADEDRLLAAVPVVELQLKNRTEPAAQPTSVSGRDRMSLSALTGAFSLSATGYSDQRMGFAWSYSRSEMISMLLLAMRLNAVKELDVPLAQVATNVFAKALPLVGHMRWGESANADATGWPFDEEQVRRLPEPYNKYPPATWRAAKLATTLRSLPIVPMSLFNTRLQALMLGYDADLLMAELDKDGDKLLSKAEASNYHSWRADTDQDKMITKDELILFDLNKLRREYIRQRFGDLNFGIDDHLTRSEAIPAISESQFAKIDTDGNETLSLSELVIYGIEHPISQAVTTAPSTDQPQSGFMLPPSKDDANRAWAERQIAKYDKNKDGQLSVDEWSAMIVKPKEGTDANGDGLITLEEYVGSRRTANAPAPKAEPAVPKPDSSAVPIYEGKTLEQWLHVFENDLSLPSRLEALKSVQMFTKSMSAEAVQPITQRILAANDAYQIKHPFELSWLYQLASHTHNRDSTLGGTTRPVLPNSPTPRVLSHLKSNLSEELFLNFIKEKLTTTDPKIAAHWMYGVCWNQQTLEETPYDKLYEWLLEPGRVKSFDPQVARLAVLYFELQLGKKLETTKSDIDRIIGEVRAHPSVGIEESLVFEPLTRGQNRGSAANLKQRVDATVVEHARQTLASDDPTSTAVTLAACRLATSRSSLSDIRAELIPIVAKRLKVVLQNPDRLLAKLPFSHGEFYGTSQDSLLLRRPSEQSFGSRSHINSEALALLSLVERLKIAKEVELELTNIFLATSSAAVYVETNTKVTMPVWSWNDIDLEDGSASSKVGMPLSHWNAAAINRTIAEIRRRAPATLSTGILADAEAQQLAKVLLKKFDSNQDSQLTSDELKASGTSFAINDKTSSWDMGQLKQYYLEQFKARGLSMMSMAEQMIKKKDQNGDGRLSKKEAPEVFDTMDTDEDGLVSTAEFASSLSWDYEMRERMQSRSNNK